MGIIKRLKNLWIWSEYYPDYQDNAGTLTLPPNTWAKRGTFPMFTKQKHLATIIEPKTDFDDIPTQE